MGYTRREFLNNLRFALKDREYSCDDHRIEIPLEQGRVVIRLGDDRQRRIASLSMPCMTVDFCFENLDGDQRARFFNDFQRSFQKGGG